MKSIGYAREDQHEFLNHTTNAPAAVGFGALARLVLNDNRRSSRKVVARAIEALHPILTVLRQNRGEWRLHWDIECAAGQGEFKRSIFQQEQEPLPLLFRAAGSERTRELYPELTA